MYPNQVEKLVEIFCGRLFLHLRPLRRRVTHTGCDISTNTFFFFGGLLSFGVVGILLTEVSVFRAWFRGGFVVTSWRISSNTYNTWSFCLYISKSTSHSNWYNKFQIAESQCLLSLVRSSGFGPGC